jgi:hypothetical protein
MKGLETMMLIIALTYGDTTRTADLESNDLVEAVPSVDVTTDEGSTDVS